jgi:hypothetical protein
MSDAQPINKIKENPQEGAHINSNILPQFTSVNYTGM